MERHRKSSKEVKATKAAALLIAAVAVLGANRGHYGHVEADRQVIPRGMAVYDANYHKASAAGKFDIQFINVNKVTTKRNFIGGRKLLTLIQGFDKGTLYQQLTLNNACLANSAYDITGGSTEIYSSGLFSSTSIETKTTAAAASAEINPSNPDDLIIHSGSTGIDNLNFSGLQSGDKLVPLDSHTKDVLATYGCKSGVVDVYNYGW